MFQLDEQFLADIGLADLPDEQKKPFLQHIYEQLEYKVGITLSEGMSDEQLQEFEDIIDKKESVVEQWISTNAPDYRNDPLLQKLADSVQQPLEHPAVKAEYAATKWLEVNRPDYRDVVAKTLEDIKQEILQNRDAILGSAAS